MRRWGHAEQESDSWYMDIAKKVYRPDIYASAAKELIAEGKLSAEDFPDFEKETGFKPVSPLAWLPLVTMLVSAVYVTDDPSVPKPFAISMITVMLCCLWPTVINTAVGVASISQDVKMSARYCAFR